MSTEKHKIIEVPACVFCGDGNFDNQADFRGTTEICKNDMFTYAKCKNCGTINNITQKNVDYTNYVGGKKKFKLRILRVIRFLKKNKISKDDVILDYGCGSGVFAQSLRQKGYNVEGYEPYNPELSSTLESGKTFSVVYLIQVFEHISDFKEFFMKLSKITVPGSKIITIHPSSTRMSKLDPKNALQCWTIHAPYHVSIPSDQATINVFSKNGYKLLQHIPYDVQRSGFIENNCVSALLRQRFGGTREGLINASKKSRIWAYLSSPVSFFDRAFIHTKDYSVSTFIFERIK